LLATKHTFASLWKAHIYAERIKVHTWDGELEFYKTKDEEQVYLSKYDPDNAFMDLAVVDFVKDNVIQL
jgi:hypothetical protein